ncbi:site-specific integrase [Spirillospora sp. NPDC049652]
MRGTTFKKCGCRNPETGRKYSQGKCPRITQSNHGAWWARFDAPAGAGEKRRQPILGPYKTKKEAQAALSTEMSQAENLGFVEDRRLRFDTYLEEVWLPAKKDSLSKTTYEDYLEIVRLYLVPGLGHLKLVDVKDRPVLDLYEAVLQINRSLPEGEAPSELLRRLLRVRALSARRAERGGAARRKQTKPLSRARVMKIHAVLQSAMNWAVRSKRLTQNPIAHVEPPRIKGRRPKPLVWTAERVERWQETGKVPGAVMVWTAAQTGAFLDFAADERLYALFHLVVFRGLRRAEVAGQSWADSDLHGAGTLTIRETFKGDGEEGEDEYDDTKSKAGDRTVALDETTISVLLDWRAQQAREKEAAGPQIWADSGRMFTKEDGSPLRPEWLHSRFGALIDKYATVRRRHDEEGWSVERIARRHRLSERAVRVAIEGGPLPPIRFHDLRHGAATLALLGNVNMKVISETLGHARHSFTADTYTSVLPEVSRAAAEAVAAVVPRRSTQPDEARTTQAQAGEPESCDQVIDLNVISLADRRQQRKPVKLALPGTLD